MGTEQVECYEDIRAADYRRLIAVLAGPVFTDRWPTGTWPLDEVDTGDIGYVARLCKWLKFDVVELFVTECRVRSLLGKPSVHGAIKAVQASCCRMERSAVAECRSSSVKPGSMPRPSGWRWCR